VIRCTYKIVRGVKLHTAARATAYVAHVACAVRSQGRHQCNQCSSRLPVRPGAHAVYDIHGAQIQRQLLHLGSYLQTCAPAAAGAWTFTITAVPGAAQVRILSYAII
jgi:hypothetical protein